MTTEQAWRLLTNNLDETVHGGARTSGEPAHAGHHRHAEVGESGGGTDLPGPGPRLLALWEHMAEPQDPEAELDWRVERWRMGHALGGPVVEPDATAILGHTAWIDAAGPEQP